MFTGLIEEIGTINTVLRGAKSSQVTISASVIFSDLKLGDSVATNGVCLTVSEMTPSTFTADIMHETMKSSSLGGLKPGTKVNLERAMRADGRYGGHMVSGHIDGVGTIDDIKKDDNAVIYYISTTADILRYIVKKGSIAIDGISLTVVEVTDERFSVSIIPHTLKETILLDKSRGDVVNLEVDMVAKYIEKMLAPSVVSKKSKLTKEFLFQNGF